MANGPIIRIDLASSTPVYKQIVSSVRSLLVGGAFQPGDPLPTVRELAMRLGVSHNTVADAYRLLADEGWLDVKQGRGVIVNERARPEPLPEARAGFGQRLRELVHEAHASGLSTEAIAGELRVVAGELPKE